MIWKTSQDQVDLKTLAQQLLDKNAKTTTRELAKKYFSQSFGYKNFLTQNTPNSLRRPLKDSWRGGVTSTELVF